MDQLEVVENMLCDSLKKTDKIDDDTMMESENVNQSSSPSLVDNDKNTASLWPITPFSNKESVNSTCKFIAPSTVSSSMSIDDDIPSTPADNVFDSLAAVSGLNRVKLGEKKESYVARKLHFNSGVKELASDIEFKEDIVSDSCVNEPVSDMGYKDSIVSDSGVNEPLSDMGSEDSIVSESGVNEPFTDMGFKDGIVSESVYESILEDIVSKEAEEILAEIVAADVPMTPTSAPRLSGIAETCPGAPLKPARKMRNIDSRFRRKLEF